MTPTEELSSDDLWLLTNDWLDKYHADDLVDQSLYDEVVVLDRKLRRADPTFDRDLLSRVRQDLEEDDK